VDEAFDAFLDLDERAVIGEAHDLAAHPAAGEQAIGHGHPRIVVKLLEAERDAVRRRVVLEHDDFDDVTGTHDLRRMAHAAPRHVGHMEQTVDAAEVDERAVVGDVLDGALENDALFENLERLAAHGFLLFLEQRLARNDDVAARAVELEDRELSLLADVTIEAARGTRVDVRARKKRGYADVDLEAALDAADDGSGDGAACVEGVLDDFPDDVLARALVRESKLAVVSAGRLDEDVDVLTFLDEHLAVAVAELPSLNDTFRFVTDVDGDHFLVDRHDPALDHFARLDGPK
jgi:hypothetical protein